MKNRRWRALGQALKALREARDLGQKEVIKRSGESWSERTLRGYESGELRPPRSRLLGLIVRSFELENVMEVNRHLRLAGYSALADSETQQFGLQSATGQPTGSRSVGPPGPPADLRVEACSLVVADGRGREVWRHQFQDRLFQAAYGHQDAIKRCAFGDIDGDRGVETLFVHVPLNWGSVGTNLICFAADGRIKWQFVPGRVIRDTRQEYRPPYFISNVQIIPIPKSPPRILVSSNHHLHNPNQIAMLDTKGELIGEYWHSGHLLSAARSDLNGDGIEEILLAGVNNGYRQGVMVIFDPRAISGVSSQPGRQILGHPPGTEKAVVLFPRTCLAQRALYTRVVDVRVTRERRIVVVVAEGVSESRNPGLMIYELDYHLRVISARPDSHLQENHRMLEEEGVLDHSWTEDENERLRRQVVVKGRL